MADDIHIELVKGFEYVQVVSVVHREHLTQLLHHERLLDELCPQAMPTNVLNMVAR